MCRDYKIVWNVKKINKKCVCVRSSLLYFYRAVYFYLKIHQIFTDCCQNFLLVLTPTDQNSSHAAAPRVAHATECWRTAQPQPKWSTNGLQATQFPSKFPSFRPFTNRQARKQQQQHPVEYGGHGERKLKGGEACHLPPKLRGWVPNRGNSCTWCF